LNGCTPHGKLERHILTRSSDWLFYRAARRVQWGEGFFLQSPTRNERPSRESQREKNPPRSVLKQRARGIESEENEVKKSSNLN